MGLLFFKTHIWEKKQPKNDINLGNSANIRSLATKMIKPWLALLVSAALSIRLTRGSTESRGPPKAGACATF